MARRRVGVALLLPQPVAAEVDALRRALGADDVDRLPPHLTLVPPVNVREDELDDALDRLRDAAARTRPFRLRLGPPATFLPVNPVLFLQVGGEVAAVDGLRDRVFRPPLERRLTWPFQPHVTILDNGAEDRVRAGVAALAGYVADVAVDRVHLLEEQRRPEDGERVWRPIAEASFGGAAVVGRGGLELELEVGQQLPFDAVGVAEAAWRRFDVERFGEAHARRPLAVTARRGGRVLAAADGHVETDSGQALLSTLIVEADVRNEGVGAHVVAAFSAAAAERGATELVLRTMAGGDAERFYRRLGFDTDFPLPRWRAGREFVQLRRDL